MFAGINTVEKFAELNLPIAGYTQRGETRRGNVDIKREIMDGRIHPKVSLLIEIDLGQIKKIKEMLCLPTLDCHPLTWGYQEWKTQTYVHSFI